MSDNPTVHRRTVLKRTGAALALSATLGTATASEDQWYVVNANGDARTRLERRGFTVANELAGGDVLLVRGSAGETDRIASLRHVASATVDVTAAATSDDLAATPAGGATAERSADSPDVDRSASETTDEPYYGDQWDKDLIDLPAAHERTTGEGTRIAFLDSGIHADHPDLDVNEDLSRVVTREAIEDREVTDHAGHGTHVAGIATASINDDVGIAGVAPDAEAVSIRADYVPEGGDEVIQASLARRLVGLEYAASIDADIVCSTAVVDGMIREFPPEDRGSARAEACRRLIQGAVDAGTVVVQAAGNYLLPEGGANFQKGGEVMFPGFVPAALTVGATGPNDKRAYYSHYGQSYLDVAAPGGGYETFEKTQFPDADVDRPFPTNGVLSTVKPGAPIPQVPGFFQDERYGYSVGTSMATPQVAGAAALVRSIAPDVNPYRVMQAIKWGAEGGKDPELGAGRLNVANALDAPVLNGARK